MSDVIFEKKGHTAVITVNRPDTLNALCEELISHINSALDTAENDPDVFTIVITGSGRAFIAGADIGEMYEKDREGIRKWASLGCELNARIESMAMPVIAAINGYALGGGLELALACDIRIASSKAKMGLPETGLGVICGAGGTQRLPRIVGEGVAREMIFTAEKIDAQRALSIGLINRVTEPENLIGEALAMCDTINGNGQLAIRAAKRAVNASRDTGLEDGCLFEREIFSSLFDTEDQKIGMGGFLAGKKDIVFKNR